MSVQVGDGPACTLGTPLLRDAVGSAHSHSAPSLSKVSQTTQVKNQEQIMAGEELLLSPLARDLSHGMDGRREGGKAPEQDMQEYQNKMGKDSCTCSDCTRIGMR